MPHRVFYTMVRLTSYGIKNNLDNDSGLVGQVKAYMEGVFNMKKWFRPVRVVKKYIDIVVNMFKYGLERYNALRIQKAASWSCFVNSMRGTYAF